MPLRTNSCYWMGPAGSAQSYCATAGFCVRACNSPQSRRSTASPRGGRNAKAIYGVPQSRHSAASPRGGTQC